jgi:NAD(P)H-nitrite reductase large subunit
MEHLVIIGNGITGVTIARNVRKNSDIKITLISDESKYFFSRTALMYVFMGHMKFENIKPYEDWFWEKNRLSLIHAKVNEIDTDNKLLKLKNNENVQYSKLVIATGSKSNKFGWPGQDLPGVQGLYHLQDLELLENNSNGIKEAVIVGGGLIGIELAEMLHSRGIHVTFLVREEFFWDNILPKEDAKLITRHILEYGFNILLETNLKEIIAGDDGRVRAILTDKDEEIKTQFVGLTAGVHPNIDLVKDSTIKANRGIPVNDYLETNIPDVYAAGDCAEIIVPDSERNRFEQLWYTGKMQGETLAKTILGKRTKYERGIWFNSAKFLDIEYQTYGFVSNLQRDGEESFWWEHDDHKHAIKIVFRSDDKVLIGINSFGIRLKHKVFDKWISENKTVDFVLENLRTANFDPELFKKYEKDIVEHYNTLYPNNRIKLKSKRYFTKAS